ncbi:serine hydrolase domain-containing protein [Nonomuraea aurantiaca]|uniref:serine hydrolase domain-containing protein n=1 Tax=Nonomuraea aurantiaca TaxID=2878562 RepID=UPI001CD9B9DB|nr:serine hydrolase domain-containing protein [Nonomuraea aurantiaca]MCA2226083.1 beta-lactamase family protein [Nonomuraea aurantiaca]
MSPMNGKRMAVATLVAAGLLSPGQASAQARHEEPAGVRQALDATVAAGAPGVLVRIDDDRGTWIGTSGTADLDTRKPMPREARFRVASLTKSMVAATVLQLVQEGRLSLDEPIGKRLPGQIDGGDQITVRELLNHTGGLLVEKVTGHELSTELDRRIFRPAGMTRSYLPKTWDGIRGPHATGYHLPTGADPGRPGRWDSPAERYGARPARSPATRPSVSPTPRASAG